MESFMKRFTFYGLTALVLTVVVMVMSAIIPAQAAKENVIYISENGTGDGSSPTSPLGSVEVIAPSLPDETTNWEKYTGDHYEKNSALYRAAERLASTGGKIVLVGDVSIDFTKTCAGAVKYNTDGSIVYNEDGTVYGARQTFRDFFMPTHGAQEIVITNEGYNGRLMLTEGAFLLLGGKTVFRDLDIVTHDGNATDAGAKKNFAICCNGYEAIFDEGLTVRSYSGNLNAGTASERSKTAGNKDYFVSIVGGGRYGVLERDSDITVKSGTWGMLSGSNRSNGGDEQFGDVSVTIDGGTFLGPIVGGGSYYAALSTFGNVDMTINGGTFYGNIYAIGKMKLGYENASVKMTVNGGSFANSNKIAKCYNASYDVPLTVDLTNCTLADSTINTLLNGLNGVTLLYPSKWATSATVSAYNNVAFKGDRYDGKGFKLNVTYNNGKTAVVEYTPENKGFGFELDTASSGTKTLKWSYGGAGGSLSVNVLNIPYPELLGAQVGVVSDNLGKMRFVARASIDVGGGVSFSESGEKPYGFIAFINSDATKDLKLDLTENGNYIYLDGQLFREALDPEGVLNNKEIRTFSAELTNLSIKDYNTDITVVAYFKFTYNGKEYVRYSEAVNKRVLSVANAAYESPNETADGKAFLKENIIDKYAEYVSNKNGVYDAAKAEEYRAAVVAALKETASYKWTPSTTFTLKTDGVTNTYTAGTVYSGIPYVNGSMATLKEFESYIKVISGTNGKTNMYVGPIRGIYDIFGEGKFDANGNLVSVSSGAVSSTSYTSALTSKGQGIVEKYVSSDMLYISDFFPSTDYSAIYNAWNSIGLDADVLSGIKGALPSDDNGIVAVGSYNVSGSDTGDICSSNGTSKMYNAYYACKIGDVLVSTDKGTLYMVTGVANGSNASSAIKVTYTSPNLSGNTHFRIDESVTLQTLYNDGFIPVTASELATGVKSPETTFVLGFDGEDTLKTGSVKGTVESNKAIQSITVKLGIGEKYIYNKTLYYTDSTTVTKSVDLRIFDFSANLTYLTAGEKYTLTVSAVTAGDGDEKILAQYDYTKPLYDLDKYAKVFTSANTPILKLPADLKQSAIDNMWAMFNDYNWSPSHNFQYKQDSSISGFQPTSKYLKSRNYKGILYADMRATSAEFAKTLVNGVLKIDTSKPYSGGYYTIRWEEIMGNHCSASMFHAYQHSSRVSAGYGSRLNPDMITVGNEDIFAKFAKYVVGNTKSMTYAYGFESMYESIAQWQTGDYMYNSDDGGGHTRMVSKVYVVRDSSTGKIDPDKSYVLMCEQTDTLISERIDSQSYKLYVDKNEDGITYMYFSKSNLTVSSQGKKYSTFSSFYKDYGFDTTWWMNNKYTFKELCGDSYAAMGCRPFEYETDTAEEIFVGVNRVPTFAELSGASSVIPTVVESNYPMVSVFARVTTASGETVSEILGYRAQTNVYQYDTTKMKANFTTGLNALSSGSYKISLIVELAVGEVEVLTYDYTK